MSQVDLQWFGPEDEGKTEEPTEHRLSEARKKGQVAKSQELNGALVFLLGVLILLFLAPWIEQKLEEVMVFFFNHVNESRVDNGQFAYVFLRYFLMLFLPFGIAGIIAAVVSNLIQNKGFIFSTKPIAMDFKKVTPKFGEYFKRTLFSFMGVFNIIKSIVKVLVIAVVAILVIRSDMDKLLSALHVGTPMQALKQFATSAAKMLVICGIFLVLVGIPDYFVQRKEFRRKNKMSKQEVTQEMKELDGDPEVKSYLDSAQKEMLRQNIPRAVKEADVVITNPTHYAVAVQWKREVSEAPSVTAKGEGMTAQNMKQIARENNIPMVENRPLARGLYTDVAIGAIIPEVYWRAIATVYGQINYMEKKNSKN